MAGPKSGLSKNKNKNNNNGRGEVVLVVSSIIRSIPMMSVSPGGCRPPGPPAALRWLDDGVALGLGVGPLMDGCLSPDPAGVRSVGRSVGWSVGR